MNNYGPTKENRQITVEYRVSQKNEDLNKPSLNVLKMLLTKH